MVKNQMDLAVKGKIKSDKDVVFLVVSFLASVVFLYLLVGPTHAKVLIAREQNVKREEDLQDKQKLLANIQAFNEDNKNAGVDTKKLESFISNRNNYEDYFFHLEDLARQSNLEIVSMGLQSGNTGSSSSSAPTAAGSNASGSSLPAGDMAAGGYTAADGMGNAATGQENTAPQLQEQYIDLSLKGSFGNMLYFYKALENGIPFLQEVSADFSYGGDSGTSSGGQEQNLDPVLESKMNLRFNYY